MNELIKLLRDKTHLGRFAESEVADVITRLEDLGYSIVKKVPAPAALAPATGAATPPPAPLVPAGSSPAVQQAAQVAQAPVAP